MGNNYIATITGNDYAGPVTLTCKDLQSIRFAFDTPFQLQLAEGQTLSIDNIIRLMPGKRLVAFGTWQDKSVVAKLFFDQRHAKRHMEKDLAGIKILRDHKIPTPDLYYKGHSEDKRVHALLFARIYNANSLQTLWCEREETDALLPLMRSVIVELATQHVLGVLQHDLHLKNFLLTKKTIFTLDGGQIELFPHLLPKKASMHNLALFLSQLGTGVESLQEDLFKHYAKSRGWLLKPEDTTELFLAIKQWNEVRWQRYEKKIFRDSSDFALMTDWRTFGMYDRQHASDEFLAFLQDPEAVFQEPAAVLLKAGRSATVIKIKLNQKEYVIKRYNLKNAWHRLRRALRPTRAYQSWRLAQKLNLFGVRTAKPVAFIEKRYFGLRGKSYYVTEYVASQHLDDFFMQHIHQPEKVAKLVKRTTHLLKNIAKLDITHGDLKATNILVDSHEQPVFIDLDGAAEHATLSSLHHAWRREMKRFLDNFHFQPAIHEQFKLELYKK